MKIAIPAFKNFAIMIAIFFSLLCRSQEPCGYEMAIEYYQATDPDYLKNRTENEQKVRDFLNQQPQNKLQTAVLDVPVVVHVIHLGEAIGTGSNISNAQILGAIQTLNDLYKNVNGTGVDMQINFCLAVRDPFGNPTTGINRVDGSGIASYVTNGMFALQGVSPGTCPNNNNAVKDLSKWPPSSYMNIWVVHKYCLSSGTLYGQASGQTGSVYDGVTMYYSEMAPSKITLAHEIGHMLLLNHTFQGDGTGSTCPVNNSCANDGDLICDTPPHKRGDWGAANPCTALGVWHNSRYNYMSYSWANVPGTFNETNCRFTQGQKDRARATIQSLTFINYLNSSGCSPAAAVDAGINYFAYPVKQTYTSFCAANSESPTVILKNYGLGNLTSAVINYKVDNGPTSIFNWSGVLLPDSSVSLTLPALPVTTGAHVFWAATSSPNGATDANVTNDSSNLAMTYIYNQTSALSVSASSTDPTCSSGSNGSATVTASSSPSKFEVIEDLEGATTDWTLVNGSEVNHWYIGSATSNGGNKSVYITANNSTNDYQLNASSSVHFYKDFYFPVGATNIKIKFDWKCEGESGGFNGVDRLRVYMIPITKVPQPGYQLGVAPAYTLTSIGSYYSQPTFRTDSIMGLDGNAGSVQRIVFNWRNNSAAGTQVPAAIDNISISYDLPNISAYTFNWNTVPTQTTAVASSLPAGSYTVVVTDANNCQASTSVTLIDPAPLSVSLTATTNTLCVNSSPVSLTGTPAGGIYSGLGVSGSSFDPTISDTGTFTVFYNYTDINGCSAGDSTQITVEGCTSVKGVSPTIEVGVFPNPANGEFTIKSRETLAFTIVNELGESVLSETLSAENSYTIKISDLDAGIYFLVGNNENDQVRKKIIVAR